MTKKSEKKEEKPILQERLEEAGIDEDEILAKAKEDLSNWDGYFNENIVRGRNDMNFLLREQWNSNEVAEFTRLSKPCLTFNKLYDVIKKILGEQRKNKPDLMVRSLTGKAKQEQIDLRADLIRTICYKGQNDLIYQMAFRSALMMGYGAFEICLDYENPRSFNKTIRYESIIDASTASFDPTAIMPHKGDGNFCSRQFFYTKDQFYSRYPDIVNPISYVNHDVVIDYPGRTKDTICVCKMSRKTWFPIKLLLLSNGESVTEDEWHDMQKTIQINKSLANSSKVVGDIIMKDIPYVHGERNSEDYKIRQYVLLQNQIIDFSDWDSKQLPIVFVDGDSNFIQGRQYTRSFIHEAKDSQKFINYVGSEIAAEIKNRRREQWVGTADNVRGYEQEWRNPEGQIGMLRASPDPKTGALPIKMPAWELSQTLLQQYQRGSQDIREILGFSETEQLNGRDMSGKARRERKTEGSMSCYVWFDNLNQAIEQGGRVVLDLLPSVIGDNERTMILSKRDGRTEPATFNKPTNKIENGKVVKENILDDGNYDIEIDAGPSFAVQKEVSIEFLQQTLSAYPQVFPLIADIWASQLDVQFMPLMKERLQTLVPQDILAKEQGKQPPPPKPNPQEMMMQMEMQSKMAELKNKQEKLEIEKQQYELDKAELMLKAQSLQMDSQLDVYNHYADLERSKMTHGLDIEKHNLEREKSDKDFYTNMSKIIADLHKKT